METAGRTRNGSRAVLYVLFCVAIALGAYVLMYALLGDGFG